MIEKHYFLPLRDTDEDGLLSGPILALIVKEEMKKRELLANFYGQKGSSACNEQAGSLFQQST
jgi:hypothetical protein